jgi:biotin transport system substrate-specific component
VINQALVPELVSKSENKFLANILSVLVGVSLIGLLAQIKIPLPWTPVPITGQTLGVAIIGLNWGRTRGLATIWTYMVAGAAGLPLFAGGASGLSWGPTSGYLIGMLASVMVVGALADRGWVDNFWKALLAAYVGSVCTFAFGLLVLSYFVPSSVLLTAGLWPFLIGDGIKNLIAAGVTVNLKNRI